MSLKENLGRTGILCGPIAPRNGTSRGGYETANRRTIRLLETEGWTIEEYAYPDTLDKSRASKYIAYSKGFWRLYQRISRRIGPNTNIPFHITPLFKQFILVEFFLIRKAKKRGMKIVLDLRAGNKARDRIRFGKAYSTIFNSCVKMADVIAVEAQEYLPLIEAIAPDKTALYFPNFVDKNNISNPASNVKKNVCRLIYVGTISPEKGVPHLIKAADNLKEMGVPVQVDIIGRPTNSYSKAFQIACSNRSHIHAHGPQPFDYVREQLDQSHFFVFLTKWKGEGQSNALTEAMARGCIPIVTKHGFNESTIGDCGVAINDREQTSEIAEQILTIWRAEDFSVQTASSILRIQEQFSENAAKGILTEMYENEPYTQQL